MHWYAARVSVGVDVEWRRIFVQVSPLPLKKHYTVGFVGRNLQKPVHHFNLHKTPQSKDSTINMVEFFFNWLLQSLSDLGLP
jgi:hypothetical protein